MEDDRLQPVAASDMRMVFEWANDPETRNNSFASASIPHEQHASWFSKKLNSVSTLFYIYYSGEHAVGQIRAEMENGSAFLSYSIAPSFRGKGYGKKIVELLEKKIFSDHLPIRELKAQVKYTNAASQRIFEKLLYKREEMQDRIEYTKFIGNGNGK